MPKEVEKNSMAELKKLKNMSPMSAEATVVRNYLDDGLRTKDIISKNMKEVSTSVMGDAIIAKLK